jgi:5'-nucleotidase
MSHPLLLVTNDDGVDAPGIRALAASLESLGDVYVVAPDREVSACGQSLTLGRPVEAREVAPRIFAANGTPADCVGLAAHRLLGRRPDLVISGINRGPNLGEDVFYSGTVGGAREAVFLGIPALAVSLATRGGEGDFGPAASVAARLAHQVLSTGLPDRTLLNVNVPLGQPTRAAVTIQGRRVTNVASLLGMLGGGGSGQEDHGPRAPRYLSDIEALQQGLISITPLSTDTTHHGVLSAFVSWERVAVNGHGR